MGVSLSRGHASHGRVLDSGLRTDARVHPFLTDRADVYRDGACLDRWGGQGHDPRALGAPLTRASAGAGGCERLRTPDIQAAYSEGARGALDFGARRLLGDARDNDLRWLEARASHL